MASRMAKPLMPPNIKLLASSLTVPARLLFDTARAEADRLDLSLWAIGGTVRDAVSRRPVVDVDLAADRNVEALATAVAAATGGTMSFEARFGTARIDAGGEWLDLATLRDERYQTPGELPMVELGASIEADLKRRDFSVNAIALGLTGDRREELFDPFGGLSDLAARRLKVLHDRSFEDDPTRLWRAARLCAHHDLRPTTSTTTLLHEGARWLDSVSGDRLWSEFTLIAERGRAGRTLALLDDWGVLAATSPALALTEETRDALRHRWRPLPVAQLAAALLGLREGEAAEAALSRLNAPREVVRAVEDTRTLLGSLDPEPDRLESMSRTNEEGRQAARWLDSQQIALQQALRRWERTAPHLNATDLLAMGVAEGPALGTLLGSLRRGRYLGTLGTVAEARALVRRHLGSGRGRDDQRCDLSVRDLRRDS